MAKNKKRKPQQNQEIKKSDIADAAFKKKWGITPAEYRKQVRCELP